MPYTELPPRPYSKIRTEPPSVTTIIALHAIPGLPWAAARETAAHAVDAPETWTGLPRDEAVDYLRRHHKGIWDGRAAMGTALHKVMEATVNGKAVGFRALVEDMAANDNQAKTWAGHEDWAESMLFSYIAGLDKWWLDFKPTGTKAEVCVRSADYVGTRDLWATINGETWVLDIKTTSELDSEKGVYHDSWALQLAAYRYATHEARYAIKDGKVVLEATRPNKLADRAGVIHLRGDHSYTFYEVAADKAAHDAFMNLAAFGQWAKALPLPKVVTHA